MRINSYTFLLSIFLLLPGLSWSQVSDDFSDLDFTNDPTWTGSAGVFIVNADTALQLNNAAPTGADVSFLTTAFGSTSLAEKEWQFWIKQGFSGSANNHARFWLAVSNPDPTTGGTEGYFLQFGEAGSNDAIELFYSNNGATTSVCRGADAVVAGSFEMRIRVRRDASGVWSIDTDATGGHAFAPHATGTNATLSATDHLGVVCTYTSSNATKFYYDDVYFGDYILDLNAPSILSATAISTTEVDVLFSEAVDATTAQNLSNYTADGGLGNPISATLDGGNAALVHLTFSTAFVNGTVYNLTISNIEDLVGNVLVTTTEPFVRVVTVAAGFRDVVINEFMCDPSPVVGLAEVEFVEVFNTSANYIDITGWKLGDASAFGTVGAHIIGPGEYALLVATSSAAVFAFYPNVVTVTSFPSLNNAGDEIILQDTGQVTIDQLSYDLTWYGDVNKDDGGYSIEQVNPFAACSNASNWKASINPLGGTPVAQNSVFDTTPDTEGPSLISVSILGTQSLLLQMTEAVDAGAVSASNIVITPDLNVVAAAALSPANNSIAVNLTTAMDTGVVYTLSITGILDCEGNTQGTDSTRTFILPFVADSGDLVINEVLFNPYTGGSDYVELVNVSSRPVNLKGWMLATFDGEDGVSSFKTIIAQNYAVPAGGYVLIAEDTTNVMMNYIQHGINNFIEADMPSYNNDSGTVYLVNMDSVVTEAFSYTEDMHFPLLSDPDGISLERLDVNRPVNDRGNWHSAAQTAGFGTPGLVNSQYYPTTGATGEVSMDPEIFSPDNDGYNDVLNINYNFDSPGFVGTIRIYDANGRPIRELATNQLLATTGTFTWDGTTDKGEKARIGMYVILFEAFGIGGDAQKYKLSTVLGGRL